MAGINNFYRGDTKSIPLSFTDQNDLPIDFTNAVIEFVMKKRISDSNADAVIRKEMLIVTPTTGGKAILELNETDTKVSSGAYFYHIRANCPNSIGQKTLISDKLTVKSNMDSE